MIHPKVSIITVVLNDAGHIGKTIDSVRGQTYKNIEYIIIDGKSTDGTLDVIRGKEGIDKVVSEPDRGLYDAMNKGLRNAEGEYVWFLNSGDEIFDAGTLEKIMTNLENGPDVIYGETVIIDDSGKEIGERRLKAPGNLTWKSFRNGMIVCHQSMIVRREKAPEFNLEYTLSADIDWAIRVTREAKSIHNTRMYVSRFMEGGLSGRNIKKGLRERFDIMARYYGRIPTLLRHFIFGIRLAGFYLRNQRI